MILTPAIIALLSGSLLASIMTVYSSCIGMEIIRRWDIESGSEKQLELERRTYLISTVLSFVMAFELFSLFLFIYTVDHIHGLFIGAMCAAGTLNVNSFGYPTLILKMSIFVLSGMWLVLNYTDNQGFDYPLVKTKYKFLLVITGLILLESIWQFRYFTRMEPDIITSCCGALFSENAKTIAADMAGLPFRPAMTVFYLSVILTLRTGIYSVMTGKGARIFAAFSTWLLLMSLISIISFISVYFYELPTHHCPFCLLHKEYHYIGYPLYLSLFTAGIAGLGVGMLDRYTHVATLREIIPGVQKRLCLAAMGGYVLFVTLATCPLIFSDFILE